MSRRSLKVTFAALDTSRIPDALTKAALLLIDLNDRGVIAHMADRIKVRRQGGYCGLDLWLFLIVYFSSDTHHGVKTFWRTTLAPHQEQLAALADRISLPSSSSLGRGLAAVETELLRDYSHHLLFDIIDVEPVLRHPVVQSYDANGEPWHLFDLDPTVTTLRHRALPINEDLPEPRRDSQQTGVAGYSGRKRGDIQFRRTTVQHAGSGLWIHAHLSEGNGDHPLDLELGLDSIVSTCQRLDAPLLRTLTRIDGEYGNVPAFTACRERHLPFVTRLCYRSLYDDVDVLHKLRQSTWCLVPDSLSGPRRAAAELGVFTIKPSRRTLRPDGERYEPMQVRVVASIFPKQGKATAGKLIDGWQVELFAIDAPASSWPAPEAVGAYFGRAGQENRYAQEDRELGLDRIVSYELPGQELASLVALSLWNLQIVSGFELEPVADEVRHKSGRCERVDERVPDEWPREPVVRRLVKQLDWEEKLDGYPGWSFCGDEVQVRCQAGGALPIERVQTLAHGVNRAQMLFRRPEASCQDCPQSQKCPGEGKATLTRHICIPIDDKIAKALYKRLRQLREHANQPDESLAPMVPESIGPYEVRHSLFLPAAARQVYAESFEQTGVRICVELGPSVPERPRLVALDVAEVQRRRKTWEQNVARYALPSAASVRIEISGGLGLSPRFKHLNRQETRQVRTG